MLTLRFTDSESVRRSFVAQTYGVDPYTPGKRCRAQLADILSWGLGAGNTLNFIHAVKTQGGALLTNLPVDPELPDTPQDGKRSPDKVTHVSECLLNGVSKLLGLHPMAFHTEKDGDLIHQIVPIPGKEDMISNAGADQFVFHTEGTNLPIPPQVLALACVRNTERGETNFVNIHRAMEDAPYGAGIYLRREEFTLPLGASHGTDIRFTIPIILDTPVGPLYRVDFSDIETESDMCRWALGYLEGTAERCEERVVLQPGDLLVINNHQSLHGRVGFTPDYSKNQQRWLQRQYMVRDPYVGKPADERYPHVWDGR